MATHECDEKARKFFRLFDSFAAVADNLAMAFFKRED